MKTTITFKISKDLKAAFKMVALKQNKSMTDLILAYIKRQVKKDSKLCQ